MIKIQNKFKNYKEYSQDKDIIIRDTSKRYTESNIRLKEFSELYNVVKNERNKYVSYMNILYYNTLYNLIINIIKLMNIKKKG